MRARAREGADALQKFNDQAGRFSKRKRQKAAPTGMKQAMLSTSLHDLSSKSPKDCSLTEISEIL
jgi:hypothetical protein